MNLDELLADSTPPVTPSSLELNQHLDQLVHLTEEAAAPRRPRRRNRAVAVGAFAAVGVLSVGGVAAAAGVLPTLFPWTTDSGSTCELDVSAELRRNIDGALVDQTTAAEQEATLASAKEYLATLDLESIDRQAAAEHWFDYLERTSADHPTRAELESEFQGDRLETDALLHEVDTQLAKHLAEEGHDPTSIMTSLGNRCGK